MAQHDEDLVIGTGLDSTGFEKGSEKLKEAMQGTADSIEKIGEKASKALSGIKIEPDLDSNGFDQAATEMNAKLQGVYQSLAALSEKSLQGLKKPAAVASFDKSLDDARTKIEAARQELEDLADYEFPTNQYAEATAGLAQAEQELEKFQNQQARMVALGQNGPTKEWTAVSEKLADANRRLNNYQASLDYMKSKNIDSGSVWQETLVKLEKAKGEVAEYELELENLKDKGGDHSKKWNLIAAQIREAEARVAEYQTEVSRMETSGEAYIDPVQTSQMEQMLTDLQEAEAALQRNEGLINQEAIAQARLNVFAAQEAYQRAQTANEQIAAFNELKAAQAEYAAVLENNTQPDQLVTKWALVKDAVGQVAEKIVSRVGGSVINAGQTIASFGSKAKSAFGKVSTGVKNAISKLKTFAGFTERSGLSINGLVKKFTGLGNMLKSRIKQTFLTAVFKDLKASVQAYAQYNAAFNEAMSNMKNRSSEMSANIAVAFGGLVRQFEPIITNLLNRLSEAMIKVNAIMAAIRGESTVDIAAKQSGSYADALDEQAKSAEKARKAQEKLNLTLTSYDEIHKLNEQNNDTNSDTQSNTAQRFQTVTIESVFDSADGLGNLAERIKEAIAKGDWTSLGAEVGNGLNNIVTAIDEKLLDAKGRAGEIAQDIAEGLNGLTAAFDGYAFGKALADGINLGFEFVNEFLKTYSFEELGLTMAESLNGLFDNIDWNLAGETMANGINSVIGTIDGFVSNFQWEENGMKLGDGINSLFANINWEEAAHAVSEGVKGALDMIIGFLENTDWESIGSDLADFLLTIDWGGIVNALAEGIGAAIGGLGAFITGIFESLTTAGETWGYDLFERNGELTGLALLDGILFALADIGQWILDNIVYPIIEGIMKGFGSDEDYHELFAIGQDMIAGWLLGISEKLTNIKKWIKENISDPFLKAIKNLFGISSPSKVMKNDVGKFVATGFLEGITSKFKDIGQWVQDNMFSPLMDGTKKAFEIAGGTAKSLIGTGQSIASGIREGVSSKWETITGLFFEKKQTLLSSGEELIGSLRNGVSSKVDDLRSTAGGLVEDMKQAFSDRMDLFKEAGKKIQEFISEGVADKINDITAIGTKISDTIVNSTGNGLKGLLDTVEKKLVDAADVITKQGSGSYVYNHFYNIGLYIANAIQEGFNEAIGDFQTTLESWEAMDPNAQSAFINRNRPRIQAIRQLRPAISASGYPAVLTGAFAPAKTKASQDTQMISSETDALIRKMLEHMSSLEQAVIDQPVNLTVQMNADGRELSRLNTQYSRASGFMNNGNGGAW